MNDCQPSTMHHLFFPDTTGSVVLDDQSIGMICNGHRELSYKFDWYFVPSQINRGRFPIGEFAAETQDDLHTLLRSMINDTLKRNDHSTRTVGIKPSEGWLVVNNQKIGIISEDGLWPYPYKFWPCSSYAGPFAIRNFSADTKLHLVTLARCWITDLWRGRNQMQPKVKVHVRAGSPWQQSGRSSVKQFGPTLVIAPGYRY